MNPLWSRMSYVHFDDVERSTWRYFKSPTEILQLQVLIIRVNISNELASALFF